MDHGKLLIDSMETEQLYRDLKQAEEDAWKNAKALTFELHDAIALWRAAEVRTKTMSTMLPKELVDRVNKEHSAKLQQEGTKDK